MPKARWNGKLIAETESCPIAGMAHTDKPYFGIQFHVDRWCGKTDYSLCDCDGGLVPWWFGGRVRGGVYDVRGAVGFVTGYRGGDR